MKVLKMELKEKVKNLLERDNEESSFKGTLLSDYERFILTHSSDTEKLTGILDKYDKDKEIENLQHELKMCRRCCVERVKEKDKALGQVKELKSVLINIGHREEPDNIDEMARRGETPLVKRKCKATFGYLLACEHVIADANKALNKLGIKRGQKSTLEDQGEWKSACPFCKSKEYEVHSLGHHGYCTCKECGSDFNMRV
jgi:hypothetical protein